MIKRILREIACISCIVSLGKMRKCRIYSDFNKKYNFCERISSIKCHSSLVICYRKYALFLLT